MTVFFYDAQDREGKRVRGTMEAEVSSDVTDKLRQAGMVVIDVRQQTEEAPPAEARVITRRERHVPLFLVALAGAGMVASGWYWRDALRAAGSRFLRDRVPVIQTECTPSSAESLPSRSPDVPEHDCVLESIPEAIAGIGRDRHLKKTVRAFPDALVIAPTEAANCIGKRVMVVGRVATSFAVNDVAYLCFGSPATVLSVQIPAELWREFSQPCHSCFKGRNIRVEGLVFAAEREPRISLESSDRIALVE